MRLEDILKEVEKSTQMCPVCGNFSLSIGEYTEFWKISPDRCWVCGYTEGNGTEEYPDKFEFVCKCWEIQIPPSWELDLDRLEA